MTKYFKQLNRIDYDRINTQKIANHRLKAMIESVGSSRFFDHRDYKEKVRGSHTDYYRWDSGNSHHIDQGGWVKVQFAGSAHDTDSLIFPKVTSAELYTVEIDDGSVWTAAATTAAYGKTYYLVLVPTTKDSTTESDGLINFRIIAAMNEGNFVSQEMMGYSVDNLVPAVPTGIIASLLESGIEFPVGVQGVRSGGP